jgi:hypothetical protein
VQPVVVNHSAAQISQTLPAGGHKPSNYSYDLDEYIEKTLAEEFSKLSINDPPLAPYIYPTGLARTKSSRTGRRRKRPLLTMSIKKDLTPGQICQVANNLEEDNALDYFLENRTVIFETWTSLPSMMAAASVDESVVAAFNLVHSLSRIKDRKRLNLRFAYLQLNNAIRTLDATAEVAYTDAYLHSKTKLSEISSRQLNEYVRRGQRWFTLAGPSPLLLSVYSKLAERIVYVLPKFSLQC